MEGIQVSVEKTGSQNDIAIIRVGGYIDTTTSSELERALDSLLKSGVFRIIIDLGNVDYISSAGWGIFISEIKGIRERGGDLKLTRMIPDVYEVFELLEFHYILKAFDTLEDAVNDFNGSQSVSKDAVPLQTEESQYKNEAVPAAFGITENSEKDLYVDLVEKIRQIAVRYPEWSAGKIVKELNTAEWGFEKTNTLSVWKALKSLGMGSKGRRKKISESENESD